MVSRVGLERVRRVDDAGCCVVSSTGGEGTVLLFACRWAGYLGLEETAREGKGTWGGDAAMSE